MLSRFFFFFVGSEIDIIKVDWTRYKQMKEGLNQTVVGHALAAPSPRAPYSTSLASPPPPPCEVLPGRGGRSDHSSSSARPRDVPSAKREVTVILTYHYKRGPRYPGEHVGWQWWQRWQRQARRETGVSVPVLNCYFNSHAGGRSV